MDARVDRTSGTPLLERGEEIAALERALAAGRVGEGRLVIIEGPAGIGRSRLLDETAVLAEGMGHVVVRTRGGELEVSHALGVVTRLVDRLAGALPEAAILGALRGRAARAERLLRSDDGPSRSGAATDEFALFDALHWFLANVAETGPVAVLVDDVQWADDPSVRFLDFLAERLGDVGVTLVVAVRTGEPAAERAAVRHLLALDLAQERLRPAELTDAAIRRWLQAVSCDDDPDGELVRAAAEASGGNPFLLGELIASSYARGERPDPAQIASIAPDRVRRRAVLRLAAHGPEAEQVAKACAVLGDDATLGRVRALAALSAEATLDVVERLAAAHILTLDPEVRFRHPMVRQAVHEGCAAGERPRLHGAAARLLHAQGADPEVVCRHLLAAPPVSEGWAVDALTRGARTATRRGVPAATVTYLRTALDRTPADAWDAELLVQLGVAEAACGEPTSLERFARALDLVTDPARRAETLAALGETQFRCGRQRDAAETFREGAALLADIDPGRARELEAAYMCAALYVSGIVDDAMRRLEVIAEEIGDRRDLDLGERMLLSVLALHHAMTTPPAPAAAALARRASGDDGLLASRASVPLAAHIATFALSVCGQAADAQPLVAEARRTASATGDALAFAELSLTSGLLAWARGQVTDAAADAQAAISAMHLGWQGFGPMAHAVLAQALLERGEDAEAATVIEDAIATAMAPPGMTGPNAWIFLARGRLRLSQGRPDEALQDFLAVDAALSPYGAISPGLLPWRAGAALAAAACGDPRTSLVDEEIALAEDFGLPAALGAALVVKARIGDAGAAEALLLRAVDVLGATDADAPLELARALCELGALRRRDGRRRDAQDALRHAAHLAHECGATALERRATEELRASGARPRRVAVSGVASLTPSEERIARLAVGGRSNRDIAEELYLTRNTVAWHLRNVYRKLGVGSRAELARTLGPVPE